MTICIGALCESRTQVVVLSDRMLTSSDQTLAFEHDEPKIDILFDNCVAVTAGQATLHQPIFHRCQSEIRETKPLINDVAEKIKEKYQEARREFMNDAIFSMRGLTIDKFYEMQNSLHENTILELSNAMDIFNFEVDIIVAGVDDFSHLYAITNPGVSIPLDSIGFVCIGTGTRHAEVTFAYRKFSTAFSAKKSLYIAFEAKKRAEMAGGVGQKTDVCLVSKDGCKILKKEIINELEKLYYSLEEKTGYGDEVDEAIRNLSL